MTTETFTEEQEVLIQKRIAEAKKEAIQIESWSNAEDTIRRAIIMATTQNIASGLWHPFLKDVAESMRATPLLLLELKRQTPTQPPAEKQPEEE